MKDHDSQFVDLRVTSTRMEIDGQAKSVAFGIPSPLQDQFTYRAGQHLTLRFDLNGAEVRRSYSLSAAPGTSKDLQITVKRVPGGLVSNYINDSVESGTVIEVMPPFGNFCLIPGRTKHRTFYFFGAGSGITPLYAMIDTVMRNEPYSVAHLVYGNQNANTILFRNELDQLVAQYADRLTVQHVLSKPAMWSGFRYWRRGIVDQKVITDFLRHRPPYAQDCQYYVCGPGGMNATVKAALMDLDVPAHRIHMESFGATQEVDSSVKGLAAVAEVALGGTQYTVTVEKDQTVLEALCKVDLTPRFSCQSGVCGACKAHLLAGTVHMRARTALEESQISRGEILVCQSIATSRRLRLSFDY